MRITSEGPGGRLGAAMIPVPAKGGQAFQSWGAVSGNPGINAIGAPAPGGVPQQWNRALHRSSDAPDVWYPGVYYQPELAAPPNVSVCSDNQMPVPAGGQGNMGALAARRPVMLRQNQVGQPLVTPAYRWR